jgi:hypothetical protein
MTSHLFPSLLITLNSSMSAISEFLIVIALIVLLWFAWFATGGPERFQDSQKLFLSESTLDDSTHNLPWDTDTHPFAHYIDIEAQGAQSNTPSSEYISISLAWHTPEHINLTGWTVRNEKGEEAAIGFGTKTPRQGSRNDPEGILLSRGEKAFITTGRSPIGTSFGVNICSGYIGTLQTFTPHLSTSCPAALDMAHARGVNTDDAECATVLRRIPSCATYTGRVPGDVSGSCEDFLREDINYNTCVRTYNDAYNFDEGEWRIFLGRNAELWNDGGDTISLYDEKGEFVTSVKY